jgi:hypothetical protein
VSLEQQSVFVKGTIGFEDLTAKIAKTGKQVMHRIAIEATFCALT